MAGHQMPCGGGVWGPECVRLQWGAGWLLGRRVPTLHCSQKLGMLPFAKKAFLHPQFTSKSRKLLVLQFHILPTPLLWNRTLAVFDGIVLSEALCPSSDNLTASSADGPASSCITAAEDTLETRLLCSSTRSPSPPRLGRFQFSLV